MTFGSKQPCAKPQGESFTGPKREKIVYILHGKCYDKINRLHRRKLVNLRYLPFRYTGAVSRQRGKERMKTNGKLLSA